MKHTPDTRGIRFGYLWLTPGISRGNALTYFYSAFMFVTLVTFLNFVQPYLLNDVLRVPAGDQGRVTGFLNFFHEGTALLVMAVMGAWSDLVGRRMLAIAGLMVWAAGFLLYPLAGSVDELLGYRLIIALGTATVSVMVITTMQDYPQEVSRGVWGGTNSFISSFAILLVSLGLARLPAAFTAAGYDAAMAGRLTYWLGAVAAIITAVIIRFGWYGGRFNSQSDSFSPFAGVLRGLSEARQNPRLALAYIGGFAARGDLVIIGSFFSLWFLRAGADQGISSGEALKQGGITMSALLIASWIWAPIFGWLLDRINRITGLAIAMGLAAVGYFAIGMVDDPFDMPVAMAATFILGIGEISTVVAGNALLGQESPANIRGATAGMFSLVGTFGILSATIAGGIVFDQISYTAPFSMMAGVNGLVALLALGFVVAGRHVPATVHA